MDQTTIIKDHEQLVADLDALPFENGQRRLTFTLSATEAISERFTSTNGRVHGGPATVTITEYVDGGTDVVVR